VATPVRWNELPKLGSADAFTMLSVPERLRNLKSDPWDGFHTVRQSLTKKVQQQAKDIAQGAGASSD
jgi:bifunctional non-homologous end joining protein LigD